MRTLLTLFCLGAFALTGCAEGLTGPEANFGTADPAVQTIDIEAIPPVADPDIYATWMGEDAAMSFSLTFAPSALVGMSDSDFAFVGTGSCLGDVTSPDASNGMCRIASGVFSEGNLLFEIQQDGDVLAKVIAKPDAEYASMEATLVYADGTSSAVKFLRGASVR